ncbi:MAG: hypothetical protein Kow00120_11260 [Anaerolineae bacterium]
METDEDNRALDRKPTSSVQRARSPEIEEGVASFDVGGCLSNTLKILGIALVAGLVLVCLLAALALAGINTGIGTVTGWLDSVFNPPTPAPVVGITDTVLTLVQREAVLETVRYNFEKVVPVEFVQQLGGVSGEKLLYVGAGYVSAGVDLSLIDADAIAVDANGAVTIKLPPAHLTNCVLDIQKSYIYRHDVGFLNFLYEAFYQEPDLLEIAEREAIIAFRDTALEGGILLQAQGDAEMRLRSLLMAAGVTGVSFETAEDIEPPHNPLCFPQVEAAAP